MIRPDSRPLVGVDGCPAGWIAVVEAGRTVEAIVVGSFAELIERVPADALIAIDIPIGLMESGQRACDRAARSLLGPKRHSSVFSAPIRPVLAAESYLEACAVRQRIEGKRMSQQAFGILPKIREVDELFQWRTELRERVKEVHPEVSFTLWNGGQSMTANKKTVAGKIERERLIEAQWSGLPASLQGRWPRKQVGRDDINDAFAALWTAARIEAGVAKQLPTADPPRDAMGLPMEMWA